MKKLYLFVIALLFSATLNAQWTSPGNGTTYTLPDLVAASDGVVTQAGNVFTVHSDLTISQNDGLHIDDQVSRINAVGVLITIQGSMQCTNSTRVGIYGDMGQGQQFSMRFENATDCELKTLYFSDGCGIKLIESDVNFIDCKFVYFTRDYANAVIDFMNCNPTIEDCYFLRNEGAAISSPANGQGSPRILNNQLEENVTADLNSPQINLGPGAEDTIYIVGNSIDDNFATHRVGGISIYNPGIGETKVLVRGNYIINGKYGYDQEGTNISSVVEWNQIRDNHFTDNPMLYGSGINVYCTDPIPNNRAIIRNNIITGNLWGITVINAADIDLGTEDDWGNNEIHDNGNDGVVYDLYNNSAFDIMAVGNDWGTTLEQEVEEHIFHQNDNTELGLVTFIPFIGYDVVDENNTSFFEVLPNPVFNGIMTLALDEAMPSEVVIYNISGQIVMSQHVENKINNINVSVLESNVYLVKIRNTKKTMVRRIIIK